MKKDFSTSKVNGPKNKLAKMDLVLINLWLAKNSKTTPTKNKSVGFSECSRPWG